MAEKPAFDPNKEFKKPEFDPNKPFEVKSPAAETFSNILQGAEENLPALGGLAGGLIGGGTTFGTGTIVGSGLGAAAGKGLQDFIRAYRSGNFQAPTVSGTAQELADVAGAGAKEAAFTTIGGKAAEGLGKLVGKAVPLIKQAAEITPKQNVKEIIDASKRLGIEATPGMLTENPVIGQIESSLQQSPTVQGGIIRKTYNKLFNTAETQAMKTLEDASAVPSTFQTGEVVKKGITNKINKLIEPVKTAYTELGLELPHVELSQRSKNLVANNILNMDAVRLQPNSPWAKIARDYAESIGLAKSAQDLETLLSGIKSIARDATDKETKYVASEIINKLDRMQTSNILRSAANSAINKEEGIALAKTLSKDIRQTRAGYRELMTGLRDFFDEAGFRIPNSPKDAISRLEGLTNEQLSNKLWNENNYSLLKYLSEKFPEEFQQLRSLRLAELVQSAKDAKNVFNPTRLLKEVNNMNPEVSELVFGAEKKQVLDDLRTVMAAIPNKVGPSGTPQGIELSVLGSAKFALGGLGRYMHYRALTSPLVRNALSATTDNLAGPAYTAGLAGFTSAARNTGDYVTNLFETPKPNMSTMERRKQDANR